MQVHCDTCNAMVRADDMDLTTGLAKCRFCHSVFALPVPRAEMPAAERFGGPAYGGDVPFQGPPPPPPYAEVPAYAPQTPAYGMADARETPAYGAPAAFGGAREGILNPQPGGLTVAEHDGLSIDRRWFSGKHIAMLIFSIIWWGFLVVWYGIALSTDAPLVMSLFPLIHVAAGLFIGYYSLCGFTNHTVLRVRNGVLSVRHGPLPWPGNKEVPTADIQQLYCEEQRTQGKNGVTYTYRLSAMLRSGKREVLMDGIDSPDVPRFVEERVERILRIPDLPVTGELRK